MYAIIDSDTNRTLFVGEVGETLHTWETAHLDARWPVFAEVPVGTQVGDWLELYNTVDPAEVEADREEE